jgi:Leucine-rich repeat (LRR) protein
MEVEPLSKNTSWIKLKSLNLSQNWIKEKAAAILSQTSNWINLKYLDLSNNQPADKGIIAIATNTSWKGLLIKYVMME